MLEFLARVWRALLSPAPTSSDRTEEAVRLIQRHLDEASRRRGGAPVEARDLAPAERTALARELAALLRSPDRQPNGMGDVVDGGSEGERPLFPR